MAEVKGARGRSRGLGSPAPGIAPCFSAEAPGQRSSVEPWEGGVFQPLPLPGPSPSPLLSLPSGASCLRVLPRGWPEAHNRASVLHLLQVVEVDVLIELDHFVHPENVGHPMIREDDDIEVLLKLPLLWADKGRQDSDPAEMHSLWQVSQTLSYGGKDPPSLRD